MHLQEDKCRVCGGDGSQCETVGPSEKDILYNDDTVYKSMDRPRLIFRMFLYICLYF
jgi:hypothetical protein